MYPERWLARMQKQLGHEFEAFHQSLFEQVPVSIRLNPNKPVAIQEDWLPIEGSPYGWYLPSRISFVNDPAWQAGAYYVQEAASQLIYCATKGISPQIILDLCAAPGGKTTLLADVFPEALVVANEAISSRISSLRENVIRWGASNIVITHSASTVFQTLPETFDLVLVDAPCSGEGLFRKTPEAKFEWKPELVTFCAARQKKNLIGRYTDYLSRGSVNLLDLYFCTRRKYRTN
ncbi:MAG: RsmB/NOP family class I SAM-dependent RNA methyltransferase [Bacteroidia bacterium]|nr:RsmB/NOP family class I SAM-dependent RNA methyltransferase [Bacteroidia bacterium]